MSALSGLEVTLDTAGIAALAARLQGAPKKLRPALRMAVNDTGARAAAPMKRALVLQTGLSRKVINAALQSVKASDASLTFTFRTRGGNIRLRFFGARETRQGVSAAPWNHRWVYRSTFMKAGWWPNRVAKPNWNGQVFRRTGGATRSGQDAFEVVRSGLFIPIEMVIGQSKAAFSATAARVLPERLSHHLARLFGT